MGLRAFPVLHARDVEAVAAFYLGLGFEETFRLPGEDGRAGYIGLRRDAAELAITTEDAPRRLAGVQPAPGPRHEMFIYVPEVDAVSTSFAGRVARSCASRPACSGASAWPMSPIRRVTWSRWPAHGRRSQAPR